MMTKITKKYSVWSMSNMSRHIAMAQPYAFQNRYNYNVLTQRGFKLVSLEKNTLTM